MTPLPLFGRSHGATSRKQTKSPHHDAFQTGINHREIGVPSRAVDDSPGVRMVSNLWKKLFVDKRSQQLAVLSANPNRLPHIARADASI